MTESFTPPVLPTPPRKPRMWLRYGGVAIVSLLVGTAIGSSSKDDDAKSIAPATETTVTEGTDPPEATDAPTTTKATTTTDAPTTTKATTTTAPKPTTTPAPTTTVSKADSALEHMALDPAPFAKILTGLFVDDLYFDRMDLFNVDAVQRLVNIEATSGYGTNEYIVEEAQNAVYAVALSMWDPEGNVFDNTVGLLYKQDGKQWLISGDQLVGIASSTLPVASVVN